MNDRDNGFVREWLQRLPEDDPGLAWRASLNERLAREARGQTTRPLRRAAWAAAAAVAASLSAWFVVPRAGNEDTWEPELVAWHQTAAVAADVAGPGLSPVEWKPTPHAEASWPRVEEDLEAL
ncbi:MAG: hypothetical protein WHU10_09820 [Fimbriimonadales bacterium]